MQSAKAAGTEGSMPQPDRCVERDPAAGSFRRRATYPQLHATSWDTTRLGASFDATPTRFRDFLQAVSGILPA